ncbi:hypothetical protein LshimejAT787_2200760 [Lyophyllum shimeji]|uniref:Uncharacterized protein n=1 Tax=Lyophyllum shimeji TaxID=47721 RepID=A0A9P3UUA3_LYOSH|nr:hypothetical protein LshimejAT787_2200760 [Lyophyllum shimeji]
MSRFTLSIPLFGRPKGSSEASGEPAQPEEVKTERQEAMTEAKASNAPSSPVPAIEVSLARTSEHEASNTGGKEAANVEEDEAQGAVKKAQAKRRRMASEQTSDISVHRDLKTLTARSQDTVLRQSKPGVPNVTVDKNTPGPRTSTSNARSADEDDSESSGKDESGDEPRSDKTDDSPEEDANAEEYGKNYEHEVSQWSTHDVADDLFPDGEAFPLPPLPPRHKRSASTTSASSGAFEVPQDSKSNCEHLQAAIASGSDDDDFIRPPPVTTYQGRQMIVDSDEDDEGEAVKKALSKKKATSRRQEAHNMEVRVYLTFSPTQTSQDPVAPGGEPSNPSDGNASDPEESMDEGAHAPGPPFLPRRATPVDAAPLAPANAGRGASVPASVRAATPAEPTAVAPAGPGSRRATPRDEPSPGHNRFPSQTPGRAPGPPE